MFDNNPVEELGRIIDDLQPKYICVKPYETIEVGDMVKVKIKISHLHNSICVTFDKHSYFVNQYTLDEHFKQTT